MKKIIILIMAISLSLSATVFNLDKGHSEVGFSVKHLMISNVKGKFKNFDAEFEVKNKQLTSITAEIDVNTIDTGIVKRDNHLKSDDFFLAEKYPKIYFKSTKIENDKVYGDLTMRGVTKQVVLDLELNGFIKDFKGNTRVGFTLTGKLNRKDYGLNWNKALEFGGVAVGEKVKLTIEIEAVEAK